MSIVGQPELTLVQGLPGAKMVAPLILLDFGLPAEPIDTLAAELRKAGNHVSVLQLADPAENKRALLARLVAQSEAECEELPILVAFGLAANVALWLAQGLKDRCRAVLAVGPFMGFDAPMYESSRHKSTWLTEKILRMSRMRLFNRTANYLECTRTLPGMRALTDAPVSWGVLANCVPTTAFAGIVAPVACPTVVVLDSVDADLNHDRATNQILAMNALLRLSLQDLTNTPPADVLRRAYKRLDS